MKMEKGREWLDKDGEGGMDKDGEGGEWIKMERGGIGEERKNKRRRTRRDK